MPPNLRYNIKQSLNAYMALTMLSHSIKIKDIEIQKRAYHLIATSIYRAKIYSLNSIILGSMARTHLILIIQTILIN